MRIFLDTNIFIVGSAIPTSPEARILYWIGAGKNVEEVELIVSNELIEEIRRVGRRLRNKDWAGQILARMWQECNIHFVLLEQVEIERLETSTTIPREDIEVYLTAKVGLTNYFVSANHKLIRALVDGTKEFIGLTPEQFVVQHNI